MHSEGHAGLTLLIMSLIMTPFGANEDALYIIVLSAALSALPDLDMKWRTQVSFIQHRGVTHSILFAIISGIVIGALFFYTHRSLTWVAIGFLSAFFGVVSHLIGDMFTHHAFKPLWPFYHNEIALHWFSASNKTVNEGLLTVGGITFILYFMITNGSLSSLIGG